MAFAAADVRFGNIAVGFFAVGAYFDLFTKDQQSALQAGFQNHVLARIGKQDVGHRTGRTQAGSP